MSWIAAWLRLPAVTAYLIAGLLLSPFCVGNEFCVSQLKTVGRQAVVVGILQAVTATALVALALVLLHLLQSDVISIFSAITLGAVVRSVVLFSVLVYELIGPALTKHSLMAAGEIDPAGQTSARKKNRYATHNPSKEL